MDNNLSSKVVEPNPSHIQQSGNIGNNVPCQAIIPESKPLNQQQSEYVNTIESPKVADSDFLDRQPIKEIKSIEVVKIEIDSSDQQSPKVMQTVEPVIVDQLATNKLTNDEKIQSDVTSINSVKIVNTEDSNNVDIHTALTTSKIKKKRARSKHLTKNLSSLKLPRKQQNSLERLLKRFNLNPEDTLEQNKTYLKQTTAQARKKSYKQLGLQYSKQKFTHGHGIHITGLPRFFTVYDVRSLIMLKSNFNAMSELIYIDVFVSEKDHLMSECLIIFHKSSDFRQVYKDLQGTVLQEREIKVAVDIGRKVTKMRNLNPVNATKLARFKASCLKKLRLKKKKQKSLTIQAETIEENQSKDNICNDTNQFKNTNLTEEVANGSEKEITVNTSTTSIQESNEIHEHVNGNNNTEYRPIDGAKDYGEDQDKNNLRVVLVMNLPPGKNKLKQLKALVNVKTGKDMKYFYCKTKEQQIPTLQDYLFKFLTHEDAVLFRDKLNGAMVSCYMIETKLLAVSDVETKQEKRRTHVFNRDLYPENSSDDQQAAKRSKTDDSPDDNTDNFEAAYMPVPERSSHTYGLHKKYLKNLGVQAPLETVIEVRNLHPDVDEEKLFEVFSLAGEVKKIDLFGSIANIEFDHPVEAVQAISLFHNHRLLDKVMEIIMAPKKDKISLPFGLKSIGTGLNEDGSPLKGVRTKIELREIHEMLSAIGKMNKIPNGRGIHPFKFKMDEQSNTQSDIISGNTSVPDKSLIDLLYADNNKNPDILNENIPNIQCDTTQNKSDINQASNSNQPNPNANLNAPRTRNESNRQSRPYFPKEQDWLNQNPSFNNRPPNPNITPNTQMANKGNKHQPLLNQTPMMGQNKCEPRMSNTNIDQGVQNQGPTVPTPSTQSQNKNKMSSERSGKKMDHDESSTSKESGKASDMLLFKCLPPSVSGSALAGQMGRVGEVVFCELTGPGRALVRFTNSQDAARCLKLFHRSKVDGRIIDVTLVP